VNGVAPEPATNAQFTRALAGALARPAFLAAPPLALRLLLGGEMADSTLLVSQRVVPAVALASGFTFRAPSLETALPRALERRAA
jgi:NAD dependent epimerase/dehydratase family enzyme